MKNVKKVNAWAMLTMFRLARCFEGFGAEINGGRCLFDDFLDCL